MRRPRSTTPARSSPKAHGPVKLRMPSRRDAVAPTVERLLEAVRPASLSAEQRDDLAVALSEALANAAVHGNSLKPEKEVRIAVDVKAGQRATIQIEDQGRGFDHEGLHDPTHPERVLVPGGRGVFLMRRLVDALEYNDTGNVVRLTVRSHRH